MQQPIPKIRFTKTESALVKGALDSLIDKRTDLKTIDYILIGTTYLSAVYISRLANNPNSDIVAKTRNIGLLYGIATGILLANKGNFINSLIGKEVQEQNLLDFAINLVRFKTYVIKDIPIKKVESLPVVSALTNTFETASKKFLKYIELPKFTTNMKQMKISPKVFTNFIVLTVIGIALAFVGLFGYVHTKYHVSLAEFLEKLKTQLLPYLATDIMAVILIGYLFNKIRSKAKKSSKFAISINENFVNKLKLSETSENATSGVIITKVTPRTDVDPEVIEKIHDGFEIVNEAIEKHLTENLGRKFHFKYYIIKSKFDNASVSIGSGNTIVIKIYVDSAHTIWRFTTAREIAAVIAHELGHVYGSHLFVSMFQIAVAIASLDFSRLSYLHPLTKAILQKYQQYIKRVIERYKEIQADRFVKELKLLKDFISVMEKFQTILGDDYEKDTVHGPLSDRINGLKDLLNSQRTKK